MTETMACREALVDSFYENAHLMNRLFDVELARHERDALAIEVKRLTQERDDAVAALAEADVVCSCADALLDQCAGHAVSTYPTKAAIKAYKNIRDGGGS